MTLFYCVNGNKIRPLQLTSTLRIIKVKEQVTLIGLFPVAYHKKDNSTRQLIFFSMNFTQKALLFRGMSTPYFYCFIC